MQQIELNFYTPYFKTSFCSFASHFSSGLDMSRYLLGEAAKLVSSETPPLYDLYAVVYHYGNSYIGHYTNAAKPPSSEGLGEDYSELCATYTVSDRYQLSRYIDQP